MSLPEFIIDGNNVQTWQDVKRVVNELVPDYEWDGFHLDVLDDILWGGFGTPDEGYAVVWLNSDVSQRALNHDETRRWLEAKIKSWGNNDFLNDELNQAKLGVGLTLFEIVVRAFRNAPHNELRLE